MFLSKSNLVCTIACASTRDISVTPDSTTKHYNYVCGNDDICTYEGFMVIKAAQLGTNFTSFPSNKNLLHEQEEEISKGCLIVNIRLAL